MIDIYDIVIYGKNVMKVRIKYSKTGPVKFISHLDVMRYFQKAIRRAELDISYSTGMSPHQIISFAAPMPLMMESVGEYCDAEFESVTSSQDIIDRFNKVGSPYIKMIDIVTLPDNAVNSMAAVTASDYMITLTEKGRSTFGLSTDDDLTSFSNIIDKLMAGASIEVLKKTKKSEAVTDIKPYIFDIAVKDNYKDASVLFDAPADSVTEGSENDKGIYMLIATGSHDNIKPENVLTAICDKLGVEYNRFDYNILRLETYYGDQASGFKPLSDAGEHF